MKGIFPASVQLRLLNQLLWFECLLQSLGWNLIAVVTIYEVGTFERWLGHEVPALIHGLMLFS